MPQANRDFVLLGNPAKIRVKTKTDPEGTLNITAILPGMPDYDFSLDSGNWNVGHVVTFTPTISGGGLVYFQIDGYPTISDMWNVEIEYVHLLLSVSQPLTQTISLSLREGTIVDGVATFYVKLSSNPGQITRIIGHFPDDSVRTFIFDSSTWDTEQTVTFNPLDQEYGGLVKFRLPGYSDGSLGSIDMSFPQISLVFGGDVSTALGEVSSVNFKLGSAPGRPIVVIATKPDTSSASYNFDDSNWDVDQNLLFTPTLSPGGATVTFNISGYPVGSLGDVTIVVFTLLLSAPATVIDGDTATITATLSVDPLRDVSVVADFPSKPDETITLNSSNWSTGATVSFIPTGDVGGGTVSFIGPPDGTVTVGVTYVPLELIFSGSPYSTTAGVPVSILAKLNRNPFDNVSVVAHLPTGTTQTLNFTTVNFNSYQTVTFTPTTITGGVVTFTGAVTDSLTVTVNPASISLVVGGPTTVETGHSIAVTVRLSANPYRNVSVVAHHYADATQTLSFTPANWNSNQTVTFTSTQPIFDDELVTLNPGGTSTDNPEGSWTASVTPEMPSLVLGGDSAVPLGNTASILVTLSIDPHQDISITADFPSGPDETFVLNSSNWSTGHTVSFVPTTSVGGATVNFNPSGTPTGSKTITVVVPVLVITPSAAVEVGYNTSASFLVKLDRDPQGSKTVTMTAVGSPTTATLHSSNWSTGVTMSFTVQGLEVGGDFGHDTASFTLGSGYPTVTRTVYSVKPDLVITPASSTLTDQGSTTVHVRLNRPPEASYTIYPRDFFGSYFSFTLDNTNWFDGHTLAYNAHLGSAAGEPWASGRLLTFNASPGNPSPGGLPTFPVGEFEFTIDNSPLIPVITGVTLTAHQASLNSTRAYWNGSSWVSAPDWVDNNTNSYSYSYPVYYHAEEPAYNYTISDPVLTINATNSPTSYSMYSPAPIPVGIRSPTGGYVTEPTDGRTGIPAIFGFTLDSATGKLYGQYSFGSWSAGASDPVYITATNSYGTATSILYIGQTN